ncbi:hypothetical protein AbraIFM66950_004817 [Aspergillus brasiliensis]|nr:hypothetical protein AbraIFM66950_004817 [Aspergillus brasiliensis]
MDEEPNIFCNICGGPPTYRNLIKRSSLQYLAEQDQLGEHEAYDDYCTCGAGQEGGQHATFCNYLFGYDARDVSLKDIKWLGDVRLVAQQIPDAELFTEKDSADLPVVSPLAEYVGLQSGHFFYPCPYSEDPRSNVLECNRDGFLVHDACLEILKLVWRDTISAIRPIDLRDFVSVMEQGLEDRNSDSFDWGYGTTFSKGPRFEPLEGWVPWEDSEWTVMDPNGPVDLRSLITEASSKTDSGFTFVFHHDKEIQDDSDPRKPDHLSLIPYELRFRILEMLPTQSVLNAFLASPHFRQCAQNLPRSFWKSRLFFNMPWCADMVLSQVQQSSRIQWNELLRLLKDAVAVAEQDSGSLEYSALKNRRRIWRRCEQIVKEIESQQSLRR